LLFALAAKWFLMAALAEHDIWTTLWSHLDAARPHSELQCRHLRQNSFDR